VPEVLKGAGGAAAPPPAPPLAAPPAAGPALGAAGSGSPSSRFDVRALAWALVVLALGAAFGAGGYWYEQSLASWRPTVTRDGRALQVATPQRLPARDLALGGDNLAWTEGPFTVLVDLRTGHRKLLGTARRAADLQGLSASAEYVAWSVGSPAAAPGVWVYSAEGRRRQRLPGTEGVRGAPAVSGSRAAWVEAGPGAGGGEASERLIFADLAAGRRSLVTSGPSLEWPALAGDLVAWLARPPGRPPVIEVRDLQAQRAWSIAPYAAGQTTLLGIALAGRTLVWSRLLPGVGGQVLAYDLDTAAVRVLASMPEVSAPAAEGGLAAWAQSDGPGAGRSSRVLAVRLPGGAAMAVAEVDGRVVHVAVSGNTVALLVEGGSSFSGIRTVAVPR